MAKNLDTLTEITASLAFLVGIILPKLFQGQMGQTDSLPLHYLSLHQSSLLLSQQGGTSFH